jgi:hypothetical protein
VYGALLIHDENHHRIGCFEVFLVKVNLANIEHNETMKRYNDDSIKRAFGESQRNPVGEFESNLINLEAEAMDQAKKLNEYMLTDNFEKVKTIGISISTKNGELTFQSTTVKFEKNIGESCKVNVSVPMSFSGEIRLWTEDFSGRKVWSTVDKIYEAHCNNEMLFDFLGKYTNRFTIEEMSDDLPF